MVDKYTWVDMGSSYLPSDVQAAYLWGQLEKADLIAESRLRCWNRYDQQLRWLEEQAYADLPRFTVGATHNGHCFYIKLRYPATRPELIAFLKAAGILTVFHYVPLHSAEAGRRFGRFYGEDRHTTSESERLLRLPMFYSLTNENIDYICDKIAKFFKKTQIKN